MDKITQVSGIAVPLKRSNVDTDQIIPAVFLKRVTKTGFEDDKAVLALPALRQAIAPEKNMAGLVGCAISRVIHVVVGEGKRITVARKFQASRLELFH